MPGHGYRYGQRPPDYEPPAPLPLVPDLPQINGRLAAPHEVVVLARAYAREAAADAARLGITEGNREIHENNAG
jgi:hypothetical protein